jgi:hypothetical protein
MSFPQPCTSCFPENLFPELFKFLIALIANIEARIGAREIRLKPLERTKNFPSFEWSNFDFLSKISHKTRKNQKCQKYDLVFYALRPLGKRGKSSYNKMLRTKAVGNLVAVIFPQRKRKSDD